MVMQKNGDILLHQRQFTDMLLEKYGLSRLKGSTAVQKDKLPEEMIPTAAQLKKLQCHSGEFNWLANYSHSSRSFLLHLSSGLS